MTTMATTTGGLAVRTRSRFIPVEWEWFGMEGHTPKA